MTVDYSKGRHLNVSQAKKFRIKFDHFSFILREIFWSMVQNKLKVPPRRKSFSTSCYEDNANLLIQIYLRDQRFQFIGHFRGHGIELVRIIKDNFSYGSILFEENERHGGA